MVAEHAGIGTLRLGLGGWDLLLRQVKILRIILALYCSLSQIRFVTDGLGGWDLLLRQIKILE